MFKEIKKMYKEVKCNNHILPNRESLKRDRNYKKQKELLEIPELENKILEIKNLLEEFNHRFRLTEESVNLRIGQ